jgi:hypothetical protein
MSGHTPGPWRSSIDLTSVQDRIFATVDGKSVTVASIQSYRTKTIDRATRGANARLIAAAPDFYHEACDLVMRHDYAAGLANFNQCGCPDCTPFRAVIAKAEGR